jgi:hypothetical protein
VSPGGGFTIRAVWVSIVSLVETSDDLWILDRGTIPFFAPPIPVRFTYTLRTIVIRLPDGSLFVDSPASIDEGIRAELAALGPVRFIVSPNKLHHQFMGEWAEHHPGALLYASPGLPRKRPDLAFEDVLGDEPQRHWAGTIDQLVVRGSVFMEEVVFFHRPSRSLLLGDLIENHDPSVLGPVQRFWARRNAMLAPNGSTPRNFRLSFLRRDDTRRCVRHMLAWQPERVLLLHGQCVMTDALEFLQRAFAWVHP